MEISQAQLEEHVLETFYQYAQKGSERLTIDEVGRMLDGEVGARRVELAVRALANSALLDGSYLMNSPAKYAISEAGYKQVEAQIFERLEATENDKLDSDPLARLEAQLAPAAGRMVSFGDNQDSREQALECIGSAQEILRSSNTVEEEARDDAIANLSAWKTLIETARNFAVGAFRFMVWDRLRKVAEKGLEEVYRAALAGILITLGTIIVGLL